MDRVVGATVFFNSLSVILSIYLAVFSTISLAKVFTILKGREECEIFLGSQVVIRGLSSAENISILVYECRNFKGEIGANTILSLFKFRDIRI